MPDDHHARYPDHAERLRQLYPDMDPMDREMHDFVHFWLFGPLAPYLPFPGGIGADPTTGRLRIGGNIRADTFDPPLSEDISDADLRAALLGRAEQAVAVLEAAGWRLVDPKRTVSWGEAATWINEADPGGPNAWILRPGLDRITCVFNTHIERA